MQPHDHMSTAAGKYAGSPWDQRLKRYGLKLSPAGQSLNNWIDRAVYPSREEYGKVRSLVRAFNLEEGLKPEGGTGKRDPRYYRIFEAIRDRDPEALKIALDSYKRWAQEEGLDEEQARRNLQSSLNSRRPMNLNPDRMKKFLDKLDPITRLMAEQSDKQYRDMVWDATSRPGELKKLPKLPRLPRLKKGGSWYE